MHVAITSQNSENESRGKTSWINVGESYELAVRTSSASHLGFPKWHLELVSLAKFIFGLLWRVRSMAGTRGNQPAMAGCSLAGVREMAPAHSAKAVRATANVGPKMSAPSLSRPLRSRCANTGPNDASICGRGMRDASTASGWRRSIIWSRRERKKSSVAIGGGPQSPRN